MGLESISVNGDNVFDVLIIGAGPSGLHIATKLANMKYKVAYIEKNTPGGKLVSIETINNFGERSGVKGIDLAMEYFNNAEKSGAKYIFGEVEYLSKKLGLFNIVNKDKSSYYAKTIVICSGINNAKLGVFGEEEYVNKGVSYCVKCDGSLTKNRDVVFIGNYDKCEYLASFANKVYYLTKHTFAPSKLNIKMINDEIISINGNGEKVESVMLENGSEIKCDYVFVEKGGNIANEFISFEELKTNPDYISNNEDKMTNIDGIYVAGDISKKENRMIKTAIDDGDKVVESVIKRLA
jgi:thioredoxin reductase (NADPH)